MKSIKIEIEKNEYFLLFNGAAMFEAQDAFEEGPGMGILEAVAQNGAKGFDCLCRAIAILAEQGELARRYLGHTPGEIPTVEFLRIALGPQDVGKMKRAVFDAVSIGLGREVEAEEVDLVLLEIAQKKRRK